MSRDLTAGMVTEVTAELLHPIVLVELLFDSGDIRFWSGLGDLSWNSETWTGAGDILSVTKVEETATNKATGVQLSITGVPSATVSLALSEDYQERTCKIYFGALDSSLAIVVDPYLLFLGYMDVMDITEEGETATFVLSVENRLVALERPNKQLWTQERQQLDYPTDEGFNQVTALQEKDIVWGP